MPTRITWWWFAAALLGAGHWETAMAAPVIATAPAGEALFDRFTLTVDGVAAPVYACRVSAMPFNQVWPGYQRPLDQTELAGFAYWDMDGPVRIEITGHEPLESVVVRPSALGIEPAVDGRRIVFDLDRPRALVVEVNGPHGALHLFASPPEGDAPAPDAAGVRYFGPGVHRPGRITLESGQTVYLAAGAVVYGSIHANGAEQIAVRGRGILDVSPFERGEGGGAIRFADCRDIVVEGVILRDPDVWCCSLFGCRDARIENIKLIGLWRYNADGIDLCNSQDIVVRDCFVRAFDDAIVLKGLKGAFDERPVRHIRVSGCTIWCDWGRALELGAETCAPEFADITFTDCDIVRTTHIAMDIQHGDRARIHDVLFEDIRVEMDDPNPRPKMQRTPEDRYDPGPDGYLPLLVVIVIQATPYSQDAERGSVRGVRFRRIAVRAPRMPASSLRGFDAEHTVADVSFEGVSYRGALVADTTGLNLTVGPHVEGVRFQGN